MISPPAHLDALSMGLGKGSYSASSSTGASFVGYPEAEKQTNTTMTSIPPHLFTTVMMRNIPNNMTSEMLLDLVNTEGFSGSYDFFYLPMDFKNMVGLGYCFVNLLDPDVAKRFHAHFSGFDDWGPRVASEKVCEVTWSNALQGKDAHVERYRNSPVMHESMPDEAKPMLFTDGERIAFPEPTKRIRAPKQVQQKQ